MTITHAIKRVASWGTVPFMWAGGTAGNADTDDAIPLPVALVLLLLELVAAALIVLTLVTYIT